MRFVQFCPELLTKLLYFLGRYHAFRNQLITVRTRYSLMLCYALIHKRLRKHRLITFIVAITAITHHIYHNVFLELITILHSKLCNCYHSFWIIPINVKNRSIDYSSNIRTIKRSSGTVRTSCEPHLIINNNMDNTTSRVALHTTNIEAFSHNTLPYKSSITMH
ncbi:hypothetical protein ANAPH1_00290 [Anaplasma phagocytophilum]|nr:hypothetical protein ANAPH1_00290 [Anaplasma phagocytophilum]